MKKQFIIQVGYEGQGWENRVFIAREEITEKHRSCLLTLIDQLNVGGRVTIRRGDDVPETRPA